MRWERDETHAARSAIRTCYSSGALLNALALQAIHKGVYAMSTIRLRTRNFAPDWEEQPTMNLRRAREPGKILTARAPVPVSCRGDPPLSYMHEFGGFSNGRY